MISKALPQEKKIVYGIWKQVFAGDDGADADSAFHHVSRPYFRDVDDFRRGDDSVLPQAGLHARTDE